MQLANTQNARGFTLVELAIVLTIIGVLTGGVLKGAKMIENSRVIATIEQVNAYKAATTSFRNTYNALPGDMANAGEMLPGCKNAGLNGINCDPAPLDPLNPDLGGASDGIVGFPGGAGVSGVDQLTPGGMPPLTTNIGDETQLFWVHLAAANLIKGVSTQAASTTTAPTWNITHPSTPLGGGFIVGDGGGRYTLEWGEPG